MIDPLKWDEIEEFLDQLKDDYAEMSALDLLFAYVDWVKPRTLSGRARQAMFNYFRMIAYKESYARNQDEIDEFLKSVPGIDKYTAQILCEADITHPSKLSRRVREPDDDEAANISSEMKVYLSELKQVKDLKEESAIVFDELIGSVDLSPREAILVWQAILEILALQQQYKGPSPITNRPPG